MAKEIKALTGIRGVAAMIIVVHHLNTRFITDYLFGLKDENWFQSFIYNYSNHGYLMVELFFVLSGFVLALSYDKKFEGRVERTGYTSFMAKRFNRVYPLYFFSTLVYFFLFKEDYVNDIWVLFVNIPFFEIWFPRVFSLNNVSWSLCTEWFVYLIFPFLLVSTLNLKFKPWVLFLIALAVLLLAPILNTEKLYSDNVPYTMLDLRMSNGTGAFLRCLGSYFVGLGIYKIYKDYPPLIEKLNKSWWIIVLLIFILYGFGETDIFIDFLFGLLILALIRDNPLSRLMSSRPVYFLGLISYSVYLNHMIFLRIFSHSFNVEIWRESTINISISFVLVIFLTIVSSYLTYIFIEKFFNKLLSGGYSQHTNGKYYRLFLRKNK